MKLTEKQQQGLEIAVKRFLNKDRYTVISGYAGSRKIHFSQIYYFCTYSI